jgi:hypothetical protein
MSTYLQHLSAEDIARAYLGMREVDPGTSPVDLEPAIVQYLQRHLPHRVPDSFLVALAVTRLAKESAPEPAPAPLPTPEQNAWLQNQAEGISNGQVPDVGAMSVFEYARHREQLGIGQPDVLDFLSGSGR